MYEEFVSLSGVNVSYRFYSEKIEPEYRDGNWTDKQEFCAEWLKTNKPSICKGLSIDISSLSRDISLMGTIKSEALKSRQEKEAAEINARELKTQVNSLETKIEAMQKQADRLIKELEEKTQIADNFNSAENEIRELKYVREKEMAEKDAEIIKLKAMLFDQMMKTA